MQGWLQACAAENKAPKKINIAIRRFIEKAIERQATMRFRSGTGFLFRRVEFMECFISVIASFLLIYDNKFHRLHIIRELQPELFQHRLLQCRLLVGRAAFIPL